MCHKPRKKIAGSTLLSEVVCALYSTGSKPLNTCWRGLKGAEFVKEAFPKNSLDRDFVQDIVRPSDQRFGTSSSAIPSVVSVE